MLLRNGLLLFLVRRAIRAVATAALAAVAATQVIARGEDQRRALPVKIFALDERHLFWRGRFRHRAYSTQKLNCAPARAVRPGVRKPFSKYSCPNRLST